MRQALLFIFLMFMNLIHSQEAIQNYGNIQIHDEGAIGFHTDLVNNGTFNENLGFAGFYSTISYIEVSGLNKPVFYNVDIDVLDDLYLETSIGVTNNLSFITGKVITPRNNVDVYLDFLKYNVYSGEGDYNHVDGYTLSTNNEGEFIFPIGDEDAFRPMIIPYQIDGTMFKGAYYKEDPNSPTVFTENFDTSKKQVLLEKINDAEFWDLDGANETDIILTWNEDSNISMLTTDVESLRVVGWSKTNEEWVDLGAESITGDLDTGTIKSQPFIPNNYEALTIGSDFREVLGTSTSVNHNFGISPNGDGINDTFTIEGIEFRANNSLRIYNRWGALVYSKRNYNNTWNGISDHNLTINKSEGLPVGTYFYVLDFIDENIKWQGYIYLAR